VLALASITIRADPRRMRGCPSKLGPAVISPAPAGHGQWICVTWGVTIRPSLLIATVMLLALPACEPEAAKDAAKEAGERAKEAGERAKEAGAQAKEAAKDVGKEAGEAAREAGARAKEAGARAKEVGEQLAGDAVDKSKEMWAERRGELSDSAQGIVAKGAASSGDGVEAMLQKGKQVAPVALDVAKTLHAAVEGDVDIEPIVQDLDDAQAQAELDRRIADMPRVETIEGVDVGFKEVTQWDATGRGTESAYLILWRRDARLYGMVYRSNKRINIDTLIAEAPRLINLVHGGARDRG
jgi:vacuolar-type H+-ATPase subunit H